MRFVVICHLGGAVCRMLAADPLLDVPPPGLSQPTWDRVAEACRMGRRAGVVLEGMDDRPVVFYTLPIANNTCPTQMSPRA